MDGLAAAATLEAGADAGLAGLDAGLAGGADDAGAAVEPQAARTVSETPDTTAPRK
ncbi:MAG TPA: hypothetical protein VFS62_12435 [Chloroflexota bacterium]|nr:hypothetical protein [Chloroflexota bacterium]